MFKMIWNMEGIIAIFSGIAISKKAAIYQLFKSHPLKY